MQLFKEIFILNYKMEYQKEERAKKWIKSNGHQVFNKNDKYENYSIKISNEKYTDKLRSHRNKEIIHRNKEIIHRNKEIINRGNNTDDKRNIYIHDVIEKKQVVDNGYQLLTSWNCIVRLILQQISDKKTRSSLLGFKMCEEAFNKIYIYNTKQSENVPIYLDKTWFSRSKSFNQNWIIGIDGICEFNNDLTFSNVN